MLGHLDPPQDLSYFIWIHEKTASWNDTFSKFLVEQAKNESEKERKRCDFHAKTLELSVAGLKFNNPLGLAAGFDKNAEAIKPLMKFGFGFIEIGAVTPLAQPGNPKPRLFRLKEDTAIINRFGFNNDGMHEVSKRLSRRPSNGIVGLNLGANKNSADRISDFATVFKTCSEFIDFATVNVSSPNTENLRELQSDKELRKLLNGVIASQDSLKTKVPVFLKIAPDLEQAQADYQEAQEHKPYMTDSVLRRLHGMRLYQALGDHSAASQCAHQAIERAQEMGCGPGTALYDRVTRLSAELNIDL